MPRSQQSLENAMAILEAEFEKVEQTKADVKGLASGKLSDAEASPLPI